MKSGAIASRGGRPYRASVVRKYEQTLAAYILEDLGAHLLSDLTHVSLRDHAERLRSRPLAPNTVRRAFDPLRAILRRAHARGLIAQNPAVGLELPTGEVKPRDRAAQPMLIADLVAAHDDARDRALWATAYYAGLRLGELRALRWRHVDLAAQRIHVEESMDDKGAIGPPKTKAGIRTLPITPHLGAPLMALLDG
jgi:integrase